MNTACLIALLHNHVTMHGNRYFQDCIAQAVEIFDDDSLADFFSEKFASELKKLNGVNASKACGQNLP